jgi:hypothetical protein
MGDSSALSRDAAEILRLVRLLQGLGVKLISVADGIETGHKLSKLVVSMKAVINELYLDDLRDRTLRGLHVILASCARARVGTRLTPRGVAAPRAVPVTALCSRSRHEGASLRILAKTCRTSARPSDWKRLPYDLFRDLFVCSC